jgi:hypothetical protein
MVMETSKALGYPNVLQSPDGHKRGAADAAATDAATWILGHYRISPGLGHPNPRPQP